MQLSSPSAIPHQSRHHATVIGSGLLARAFCAQLAGRLADVTVFAAGVSNSGCSDPREFEREKMRLQSAFASSPTVNRFVYFSTCGVYEEAQEGNPYVQHKLAMEELVRARGRHVIFRLPQLVGVTPNPHTLINHLFARMVRSERFQLWVNAARNIIDVDDAVALMIEALCDGAVAETINIANPSSIPMPELVKTMERVLAVRGLYDAIDRGARYDIDIARIRPVIDRLGLRFDGGYIARVIAKYFGERHAP